MDITSPHIIEAMQMVEHLHNKGFKTKQQELTYLRIVHKLRNASHYTVEVVFGRSHDPAHNTIEVGAMNMVEAVQLVEKAIFPNNGYIDSITYIGPYDT